MDRQEEIAYALDYIDKHPTMEPRTKILLAEIVKDDLSTAEIVVLLESVRLWQRRVDLAMVLAKSGSHEK